MKVKKTVSTKAVALILAAGLVAGGTIGGTVAWLATKSTSVVNTFTAGNIDIELNETKGTVSGSENVFKMVPGTTIEKDPTVKFTSDSEACWLFVKVVESDGASNLITTGTADATTYIKYSVDTNIWTALDGSTGVYYKKLAEADAKTDKTYTILTNNEVSIPDSVTKTMLDNVGTGDGEVNPQLTFTAYAIQQTGFNDSEKTEQENAADAWTEVSKLGS